MPAVQEPVVDDDPLDEGRHPEQLAGDQGLHRIGHQPRNGARGWSGAKPGPHGGGVRLQAIPREPPVGRHDGVGGEPA